MTKFIFISELLNTKYKGQSVYTHLVSRGYKTKNGNDKYDCCVYSLINDQLLEKHDALRLRSKKTGNHYFSIIMRDDSETSFKFQYNKLVEPIKN